MSETFSFAAVQRLPNTPPMPIACNASALRLPDSSSSIRSEPACVRASVARLVLRSDHSVRPTITTAPKNASSAR
jgi:hypothetical protein